jgi:predicted nucleic acid-binding protein
MSATFVDTNIFLRHLLNDHPTHSPAAFRLIQSIERGKQIAWTSELVVAELVWVLSSKQGYQLPRERIFSLLVPLLSLPSLKVPHKRLYPRIFDLYVRLPIDYVDAYHAALIQHRSEHELYSFDTDFDHVQGLTRREP